MEFEKIEDVNYIDFKLVVMFLFYIIKEEVG